MAKTVEAKLSLEEELDQLKDAKESLEVSEKEVSRLSAKLEEKEQRLDESLGIIMNWLWNPFKFFIKLGAARCIYLNANKKFVASLNKGKIVKILSAASGLIYS